MEPLNLGVLILTAVYIVKKHRLTQDQRQGFIVKLAGKIMVTAK